MLGEIFKLLAAHLFKQAVLVSNPSGSLGEWQDGWKARFLLLLAGARNSSMSYAHSSFLCAKY